nr:putative ribonuclease h protein [Quercus suber]
MDACQEALSSELAVCSDKSQTSAGADGVIYKTHQKSKFKNSKSLGIKSTKSLKGSRTQKCFTLSLGGNSEVAGTDELENGKFSSGRAHYLNPGGPCGIRTELWEPCTGPSCLEPHTQAMVEVPHRCSSGLNGGIGGVEQAAVAITHAPLGRIGLDHLGKEAGGFQRSSHYSYGARTKVWLDRWLKGESLREMIQGPLSLRDNSLTVEELRDVDGWKLDLISFDLPDTIKNKIKALPLQEFGHKEDSLMWKYTRDAEFSTNSAYLLSIENKPTGVPFMGKWIWKIDILPKIIMFLWLCFHNNVPVKSILAARGINCDGKCPICRFHDESITHLLRDSDLETLLAKDINGLYYCRLAAASMAIVAV